MSSSQVVDVNDAGRFQNAPSRSEARSASGAARREPFDQSAMVCAMMAA